MNRRGFSIRGHIIFINLFMINIKVEAIDQLKQCHSWILCIKGKLNNIILLNPIFPHCHRHIPPTVADTFIHDNTFHSIFHDYHQSTSLFFYQILKCLSWILCIKGKLNDIILLKRIFPHCRRHIPPLSQTLSSMLVSRT